MITKMFKSENAAETQKSKIIAAIAKLSFDVAEGEFGETDLYYLGPEKNAFIVLAVTEDDETEDFYIRVEFVLEDEKEEQETIAEFDFTTLADIKAQAKLFKNLAA